MQWQPIDIPLAVGVNTRDEAKLLAPTKLVDLQNVVLEKGGAQRKRYGHTDLSKLTIAATPSTIAAGRMLASREDELVMADGTRLYSYSEAASAWSDQGAFLGMAVEVDALADSPSLQVNGECATADGITVFAWEDYSATPDTVGYAVYDTATGATLQGPTTLASNARRPRVVAVDNTILILFHDVTNADIRVKRVAAADLANTLATAPIAFGYSDINSGTGLDACAVGDYAVWCCRTNGSLLRVGVVLPTGALGGPASGHGYATTGGTCDTNVMAIHASSGARGCVVVCDAGAVKYAELTNIEQAAAGPVTVGSYSTFSASIAERVSCLSTGTAAQAHVWHEGSDVLHYGLITSGSVTDTSTLYRMQLGSAGFYIDGAPYVHAHLNSGLQGTYFLVDTEGYPFARVLPGIAYGPRNEYVPRVNSPSADLYEWCGIAKESLLAGQYAEPSVRRIRYDLASKHSYAKAARRGTLYLGGGLAWQYDGQSVTESGFLMMPEDYTGTASSGAGALLGSGTYTYAVYAEWYLANGQREQSACAELLTVVMGASDDTVTLHIPPITVTHKRGARSNISFAIYRTTKNGTARWRVSSLDPNDAGASANGYLANDPSSAVNLTFVDEMSDDDLQTKEPDYQNSGELENIAPPALRGLREVQDRLWGISSENRRRAYFSKLGKAQTAVEWNDSNYVEAPGDLVTVAELNGQVMLIGETGCWYVPGEGPDNLDQGAYGRPERIPYDLGCADPRTVVSMPDGLVFLTQKGFWLLARNLQCLYIGADVAAYNDQTFTGAELVPDASELRFLTSAGRTLVYNYERREWSTFTRIEGVSSTRWRGAYAYLDEDGLVRTQSSDYLDGGNTIAQSSTTSWVKATGPAGRFKCRSMHVLGTYKSASRIRVEVGYNLEDEFRENFVVDPSDWTSDATWGDSGTWGGDTVWGGDGRTMVFRFRHKLKYPKVTAVRFRFTELPGDDAGAGFELNTLTLWVKVTGAESRLAENRTV